VITFHCAPDDDLKTGYKYRLVRNLSTRDVIHLFVDTHWILSLVITQIKISHWIPTMYKECVKF